MRASLQHRSMETTESDLDSWEALYSKFFSKCLVRFFGGVHLGQGDTLSLQRPRRFCILWL